MCGIAGIHRQGTKPIPKLDRLANELLLAIQPRGTDATGFLALLDSGRVQIEKKILPASKFIQQRGRLSRSARTVLLHTRFATVGAREDPRNAHPVASGTCAAIHNGTIRNATDLFEEHDLPRIGTVDSEIIPALISATGWDDKSIIDTLAKFEGGAATVIVNTEHPKDVILARVRSFPLVYVRAPGFIVWASTREAIERAWRRTYGTPLPARPTTLLEGTVLRVNGKVTRLPTIPQRKIVYHSTGRGAYHGITDRMSTANRKATIAQAVKKTKHRGGKGMPRAFPSHTSAEWSAGMIWDEDTLALDVPSAEEEIQELMEVGVSRELAINILQDAIIQLDEEDALIDDFTRANAEILRRSR